MKNVLVTGHNGFVGKNLIERLKRLENVNILEFGKGHDIKTLEKHLKKADFIYHLAGINRPDNDKEFFDTNTDLTNKMIELLKKHNKSTPIVMSSSTQAKLDNPYGLSKKMAEDIIKKYAKESNVNVYVYRLPNLFGKWCKPNYNSVVATFCYNISRNLPINISNKENVLELVHIDDVVNEFVSYLHNPIKTFNSYLSIKKSYTLTVGELSEIIVGFKEMKEAGLIPNLSCGFVKALHSTYMSFEDENNLNKELMTHSDERGSFAEFLKSDEFGQISISTTRNNNIRGNHYHNFKNEKFCVLKGSALIRLRNVLGKEIIEYKVSGDKLEVVDIPSGFTHSIENIGNEEMILLIWANEIFSDIKSDTYYCEV